ncbi:hypothetical protein [Silvibacterium sp.]|uniref:hypothetical protein n=1 Tax=Silvibacterium sp. TaxID=1964179 RepID=UPI0039E6E1D6
MAAMSGLKKLTALLFVLVLLSLAASAEGAQDQPAPLSIVVDTTCRIQPESDPSILGRHRHAFRDGAICHLESVLTSHHIEEKIADGKRTRYFVRVAEQEYILENPTDGPAVFTIRHAVPANWQVDSDPPPARMDGATAIFLANSAPGQRVRLHVGMHRNYPAK